MSQADEKDVAESAEIRRLKAQLHELRQENEFLKNGGLLRAGTAVSDKYELINREEGRFPVVSMCRWAGVSRSGYYTWRERKEPGRTIRRKELAVLVRAESMTSDGVYGYRRVTAALERKGVSACEDTVRAVMRDERLQAAQPHRKVRTTVPADDLDERPDLVRRDSRRRQARNEMGR